MVEMLCQLFITEGEEGQGKRKCVTTEYLPKHLLLPCLQLATAAFYIHQYAEQSKFRVEEGEAEDVVSRKLSLNWIIIVILT